MNQFHAFNFPRTSDRSSCWLRLSVLLILLVLFSACGTEHRIRVEPELYLRQNDMGQGTRVSVRVIDKRAQRAIFEKTPGLDTRLIGSLGKVNIYPKGAVDDPIEEQVKRGLSTLGFQPVESSQPASRRLEVHILHLRMLTSFEDPKLNIPKKKVRLRVALGVRGEKPGKKFKKLYQTYQDKSQNLLTGEFKNEQFINNTISLTLQKMFEDPALHVFLSPEE